MRKIKIIKFFSGVLIVVVLATVYATIKVTFFDCRDNQCFVKECVDMSKQCDQDSYDCCIYDIRKTSFRDYLIKEIKFYSLISGAGLGIIVGGFWASRPKKKEPSEDKNYEKI